MLDLLAAANGNISNYTSYGGVWLFIIVWICYARRKKPIGGWLLYYIFMLYMGLAINIIMIIPIARFYLPGYLETNEYFLFLIMTLPQYISILMLIFLSFSMIIEAKRDWKVIKLVRLFLSINIASSLVNLIIGLARNVGFDYQTTLAAIQFSIWLAYFYLSTRVRSVFKDKNWPLTLQ